MLLKKVIDMWTYGDGVVKLYPEDEIEVNDMPIDKDKLRSALHQMHIDAIAQRNDSIRIANERYAQQREDIRRFKQMIMSADNEDDE